MKPGPASAAVAARAIPKRASVLIHNLDMLLLDLEKSASSARSATTATATTTPSVATTTSPSSVATVPSPSSSASATPPASSTTSPSSPARSDPSSPAPPLMRANTAPLPQLDPNPKTSSADGFKRAENRNVSPGTSRLGAARETLHDTPPVLSNSMGSTSSAPARPPQVKPRTATVSGRIGASTPAQQQQSSPSRPADSSVQQQRPPAATTVTRTLSPTAAAAAATTAPTAPTVPARRELPRPQTCLPSRSPSLSLSSYEQPSPPSPPMRQAPAPPLHASRGPDDDDGDGYVEAAFEASSSSGQANLASLNGQEAASGQANLASQASQASQANHFDAHTSQALFSSSRASHSPQQQRTNMLSAARATGSFGTPDHQSRSQRSRSTAVSVHAPTDPPPAPGAAPAPAPAPASPSSLAPPPSTVGRSSTLAQLDGQHFRRTKIVKEIQDTENSYVEGLKVLIKVFLNPLNEALANKKPIISQQDVRSMFSFVEGTVIA